MAARCSFCPRPGPRVLGAPPGAPPPCAAGTFWPGGCPPGPNCPPAPPCCPPWAPAAWPAAPVEMPIAVLHDRGDVLGQRVFQANDPHLVAPPRCSATSICRISSATSAMSRGLAWTIREVVRGSAVTWIAGLNPPRSTKAFWIVVCAAQRRGVFEMEDLELGPRNRRLVETGDEVLHRFHVFRAAHDQDRVGHRQGRDAHGALPRQVNFVIQGLDQGGHGLAFDVLHQQDVDRRLGFSRGSVRSAARLPSTAPRPARCPAAPARRARRSRPSAPGSRSGKDLPSSAGSADPRRRGNVWPGVGWTSRSIAGNRRHRGQGIAARCRGIGPRLHEQGRQGQVHRRPAVGRSNHRGRPLHTGHWAGCKGIRRTFRPAGSCGESRTWIKRAAASTAAAEPSSLTCLVAEIDPNRDRPSVRTMPGDSRATPPAAPAGRSSDCPGCSIMPLRAGRPGSASEEFGELQADLPGPSRLPAAGRETPRPVAG